MNNEHITSKQLRDTTVKIKPKQAELETHNLMQDTLRTAHAFTHTLLFHAYFIPS